MSHYEFKQPVQDRLTDEKWREMLETNPPKRLEWTSISFLNFIHTVRGIFGAFLIIILNYLS